MAKKSSIYVCQSCTYQSPKWMGKCPECNQWNSFLEEVESPKNIPLSKQANFERESVPKIIADIEAQDHKRMQTSIFEFDRVMGGGIVQGSLTLIGGEPGIGKSTLLLNVAGKIASLNPREKVLYVSGEESESQVADRARRMGISANNLYLCNDSIWQNILTHIKKIKPKFFILDSIQTTTSDEIASPPGTISQIREVTYEVMNYSKAWNMSSFIIGHVTKEGNIAGPKILEHMVDTVIYFEGDEFGHYRILRAIKNRYGNINEVGLFEMGDKGLIEIKNPSQYFVDAPLENSYGRSLTCIVEGSRSLFIEIQALVVENKFGTARRTTQGVDTNRVAMLVAVIEKYMGIPLSFNDIYLNVVGGIKLTQRESDLSIIASLLGSYSNKSLDPSTVFVGEVGLTGEVRNVPFMEGRIKEMEQMNYKRLITSYKVAQDFAKKSKLEIIGIKKVSELTKILN
ncbi:MAG: DNA repair protein RadA [Bacteriovoracaceae bacterium]|nr:DNA repair protein RadA [Bacteriovoracaceae bacterium]